MKTGTTLSSDDTVVGPQMLSQCEDSVSTPFPRMKFTRANVHGHQVGEIDREKRRLREAEQFSRVTRNCGLLPVGTFIPDLNYCVVNPRSQTPTHDNTKSIDSDEIKDNGDDEIEILRVLSSVPTLKLRMRKRSSVTFTPQSVFYGERRNENVITGAFLSCGDDLQQVS